MPKRNPHFLLGCNLCFGHLKERIDLSAKEPSHCWRFQANTPQVSFVHHGHRQGYCVSLEPEPAWRSRMAHFFDLCQGAVCV